MIKHCFLFLVIILSYSSLQARVYNVKESGALNDGQTLNTKAIQKAIDQCSEEGGGKVVIDGGGVYVTGTIYLKSNVTLYIDNGTTLLGSSNINDYATDTHKNMYKNEPHMDRCLIFAKDASSIAIEGNGTIDGNGHRKNFTNETGRMLLRFMNCSNIRINDVSIINPAAWTTAFLYCDDISVVGVKIMSRANSNGDGLDFDGCTNVRVSNCTFNTSDDSICMQTSREDKPCKDITVTNCTFTSYWAGIRIGLLSRGDFNSIAISNCTFRNINDAGLKIQMNEGGEMNNMTFSNLVMENVPRPIFMTFTQQRACVDAPMELVPMKAMHNFNFDNIIIDNSKIDSNSAIFITGMPGKYIEDISISNVQFTVSEGGTKENAQKTVKEYTPEVLGLWWPEFYLVGTLPAYGIYARHVKGLTLNNVQIKTVNKDERPAVMINNVVDYEINNVKSNGKKVKL